MGQLDAMRGPTSFVEMARLEGEFADWHNLVFCAVWLTGELNLPAVRVAWRTLCLRHDVMRRTYVSPEEALTYKDWMGELEFLTADTDIDAIKVMRSTLGTPFRLDASTLSRIVIIQRDDHKHLLGIALDHIITDQTSWDLLVREFSELYERARAGELNGSESAGNDAYQTYASLLRREFFADWGSRRESYWLAHTKKYGTYPPSFPFIEAATSKPSLRFVSYPLRPNLNSRVHEIARRARATPFTVVISAVLSAVQDVSGAPTVGVDVDHHGRALPGTAEILGQFVLGAPLFLAKRQEDPLATVRELFAQSLDVFEYSLPFQVAGRYWKKELVSVTGKPGVHVTLNQRAVSFGPSPIVGTQAEFVSLEISDGQPFPETLVFAWYLEGPDPELVVRYDQNLFSQQTIASLIHSTEKFLLSADF